MEVLDVVPWLREERASLIALLERLDDETWTRPTECPGWSVHGIVLHLVGDDLSLLSRQRDNAPSGLIAVAQRGGAYDLPGLLDAFNDEWVAAASFLSPRVVIDLLRLTGDWTAAWYADVPADRLGEPVPWMGPEPAAYWLIAAREYVERWVHHQQVGRAAGCADVDEVATTRAVAALAPGFARLLGPVHAPDDASVTVTVLGESWTLNGPGGGWALRAGRSPSPTAELSLSEPAIATRAFSRGLTAAEMEDAIDVASDPELAAAVTHCFVEAFSRSY